MSPGFQMIRDRSYPDFIALLDSQSGLPIDVDIHFDLVRCKDTPDADLPCTWGH